MVAPAMKILHVIDSGGLYGAEMVLLNLTEEQKRLGHHPCIASIGAQDVREKPLETEARKRNLEVVVFRMRNGPNLAGSIRIVNFARSKGFQVVHSHGYKSNILLGFLPRCFRRLPLVSTVHGWTAVKIFSRLWLYEWADKMSLKCADAVCVVNDTMCSIPQIKSLNHEKVHVVVNGIPELDTTAALPADEVTRFCLGGYTVASIGRLSPEKGYEHLIHSFSILHSFHPDTRLLIVGEGCERERLDALICSLGLKGKIMLPGYRDDAWRYLTYCRLFVLSSLTEGLPITLLEAMQVGIPIIATCIGGVPSVITHEENGILIPPGNHVILGQVLLSLYKGNEKKLHEMSMRGMEMVKVHHSARSMALGYDAVYKEVILRK